MIEAAITGLALGVILALSVGPVIFTIIKQSIYNGTQGGFSFVIGVWISDILLVLVSNIFSELVSTLLEHKKIIGYLGGLFLMGLGLYYLLFKKNLQITDPGNTDIKLDSKDHTQILLSGFLINTLNPSVITFWLVNATAFAITHSLQQRIVIFATCILFNIIADSAKVMLASKLRNKLTTKNINLITRVSGSILIVFSLALVYGVIFHS